MWAILSAVRLRSVMSVKVRIRPPFGSGMSSGTGASPVVTVQEPAGTFLRSVSQV